MKKSVFLIGTLFPGRWASLASAGGVCSWEDRLQIGLNIYTHSFPLINPPLFKYFQKQLISSCFCHLEEQELSSVGWFCSNNPGWNKKQHANFNKLLLLRFWNLHGSRESGFSFSILDWCPIVLNPAVSSADMWICQFVWKHLLNPIIPSVFIE